MRSGYVAVNSLVDLRPHPPFGDPEIEVDLESEPQVGRDAKILGQSKRRVRSNGTLPVDDRADASRRDGDLASELVDADTQRFHEFFPQDLAGMDRIEQFLACHRHTSMVINNLDLIGITVSPDEANSPLVIDANAVLALAVASQCLKPVPRRDLQVLQHSSAMEIQQLPARDSLKAPEPGDLQIGEQGFGLPGSKGADHSRSVYYVSRHRSSG